MDVARPRLRFYVHKKKARDLAVAFGQGAAALGLECRVVTAPKPASDPDTVGVFYGVTSDYRSAFFHHRAGAGALVLDNGWFSPGKDRPTFRWAWNGMQAHPASLRPAEADAARFGVWPHPKPGRGLSGRLRAGLVVVSSEQFFDHMHLGYTEREWIALATAKVTALGMAPTIRRKPLKRSLVSAPPLDRQLAETGFVASLCSAVHVRALRQGIPAATALDTSAGPGRLFELKREDIAPAPHSEVADLVRNLAFCEFDYNDLRSGDMLRRVLSLPPNLRKGIVYGKADGT